MSAPTTPLPFQPTTMSTAQLAAVSYLARYAGRTHALYTYQLRQWFAWCQINGLDPLAGIQRAHVELYIRGLGDLGLMDSSVNTMMHAVRGYFRFAHIDGLIGSDPAVYARLPKVQRDESRTQGLDRLELIRFLQVAQTISVHHGALAYLLGINVLRASEAAAVRIQDYADTLRGYRVLHLVDKGNKPATMPPHRPGAPRPGSLSGPTDQWAAGSATGLRQPDRPTRRLPHGQPHRENRRHSEAHQPALATARRDHQCLGRRRPPARRPDPRPPRRPPHHRALRPRPRQPRPTRRPLPHGIRGRRLAGVCLTSVDSAH